MFFYSLYMRFFNYLKNNMSYLVLFFVFIRFRFFFELN